MLNSNYHRLLKRQLKKSGLKSLDAPGFKILLKMVDDAYRSFDKDVKHIEHVLEVSSKELFVANQKLINDKKRTETKLESILGNVGGVIFETDLKGNFTYLNNAWAKYSGFSVKDSIGKSFKDFLFNKRIKEISQFKKLFSKEKKHIKFIFKFNRGERPYWFEIAADLINNDKGEPTGFIGTIIDVTNLKETEIELQRANKSKDEFLSTMSHEIRTPLNAVTGLANILLMEDYLPEQLENLKALKYSGDHLLGLINDLLDFNKIKSGNLKIVEQDFSLNYFLENIKSHFKLKAETKGITFKVLKENDIPDNIVGDKLRLTQVIKNLLSNSLKFTEKGSVIFSVKNLGINKNKINLQFKVTDTGIGISKSRQKSIFKSFIQADSETSIKYGGTGLGLSICEKLLHLQNSDLNVTSEFNKGSTFSFVISYKISNNLNVYKPEMVKTQSNYDALNINVLVAEDNKMNVLILKRFFSKWEVNYKIAENGKEVLSYFDSPDFDFDLVLMDLQMPILNGYQTTKFIRKLPDTYKANIPIIALTAFAQTDIKEKTKQYKMNGFMGKPFNPVKLYALLKYYSKVSINKKIV